MRKRAERIQELRAIIASAKGYTKRQASGKPVRANDTDFYYYQQHGNFPFDEERVAIISEGE